MHRFTARLLLLPLLLVLPGCLAGNPPVVEVQSIELVGVDADAMSLILNGTVENPHASEARLLQFEYVLSVDGRQVFRGRHAAEMTLSPGVTRKISLPAAFTYVDAGWNAQELPDDSPWTMSGSLVYLGQGVLANTLLELGYRPTVGYSASGQLVLAPTN
tara:strand:- start:2977 stop:3456 length:480 start_codon:yes stop_codon:yes gene_type:complete